MMAQVTAAALVSENKTLAHPASVDSIPTSANQEDHVSMATFAARRLHDMLDNVARIVAIELLAASQGLEFRLPQRSSTALQDVLNQVRSVSAAYTSDRSLSADIEALALVVENGDFTRYGEDILPSFQT
jgi:histidine ammonia-lyase